MDGSYIKKSRQDVTSESGLVRRRQTFLSIIDSDRWLECPGGGGGPMAPSRPDDNGGVTRTIDGDVGRRIDQVSSVASVVTPYEIGIRTLRGRVHDPQWSYVRR